MMRCLYIKGRVVHHSGAVHGAHLAGGQVHRGGGVHRCRGTGCPVRCTIPAYTCRGRPPAPTPSAYLGAQVDVAFEAAEALQPLPRLAFALLRSPLLAEAAGGAAGHPDAAAAARHLWAALPPGELRRAVYPALASYSDADTQARGRAGPGRALRSATAAAGRTGKSGARASDRSAACCVRSKSAAACSPPGVQSAQRSRRFGPQQATPGRPSEGPRSRARARPAQACAAHSLSRVALATSGAPLWLLDAFSLLVVYCAPAAPPGQPFPPPQQSGLRRAANALRAGRRITPALRMLRGGCAARPPALPPPRPSGLGGCAAQHATAGAHPQTRTWQCRVTPSRNPCRHFTPAPRMLRSGYVICHAVPSVPAPCSVFENSIRDIFSGPRSPCSPQMVRLRYAFMKRLPGLWAAWATSPGRRWGVVEARLAGCAPASVICAPATHRPARGGSERAEPVRQPAPHAPRPALPVTLRACAPI